MPIPIPETVDEQSRAAVDKAAAVRSLPRYLLLAGLAGAYVGVGGRRLDEQRDEQ